jgi:hypothetical protein
LSRDWADGEREDWELVFERIDEHFVRELGVRLGEKAEEVCERIDSGLVRESAATL